MSHPEHALRERREGTLRLAASYRLQNVRVFGSVANGTADDSSDLDLLVETPDDFSLLELGGFLMDVRDLLGVSVDVVTVRGLKPRIQERVLKEAIPV
jgi:predicted nucleotidyltransferase